MRLWKLAACAASLGLAACAGQDKTSAEAALINDGRDIADAHCAACHAVGSFGDSPDDAAPPFRNVLALYSEANLQSDLIEGIQVAHPMPVFQINPQGVDALIAYLRTIQEAPKTQK